MNDNNPTRVHIYSRVPRRPLTYLRLEQYQKRDTQPSRNYGGRLLDGSHSRDTTSFYALATVISHRRFTKFTRYFNLLHTHLDSAYGNTRVRKFLGYRLFCQFSTNYCIISLIRENTWAYNNCVLLLILELM